MVPRDCATAIPQSGRGRMRGRTQTSLRKVLEEYPNLQETYWGTWAQFLEAQWGIQGNWIFPTH